MDPHLTVPVTANGLLAYGLSPGFHPQPPMPGLPPAPHLPVSPSPPKQPVNSRCGSKYRSYTADDIMCATRAILEDGMSLRKASTAFRVPKTTLAEKLGDRRPRPAPLRQHVTKESDATGGNHRKQNGSGENRQQQQSPQQRQQQQRSVRNPTTASSTAQTAGSGLGSGAGTGDPAPRKPATRYTWTEADMELAAEAVAAGDGVSEAARRFGVPPSSLNSRTRGREPRDLKGDVCRLTLKQESLLAEWAGAQAALGFPATKDDVFNLAERVMAKSAAESGMCGGGGAGTDPSSKRLGKQWIVHWLRRWPNVHVLEWTKMREKPKRDAQVQYFQYQSPPQQHTQLQPHSQPQTQHHIEQQQLQQAQGQHHHHHIQHHQRHPHTQPQQPSPFPFFGTADFEVLEG